ncbi:MAG: hypothetical protein HRU07_05670 [Nitrosopumilus sp.]|nr:hypothetical protein [Nitrosopumilus sp.]NRA05634.1 hypothetical protein [Nitrosopumilus sp.]
MIPPARCISSDTQLVCGGLVGSHHHILGVKAIFSQISSLVYFANCFIQCRQSTGAGKPIIQHCILFYLKLVGFLENLRTSNTCSQGIIHTEKNVRNNHEYLTKINESDENFQCSDQYSMVESDMFYNANNFNDVKKRKTTLNSQGENTFFKNDFGNYKSSLPAMPYFF